MRKHLNTFLIKEYGRIFPVNESRPRPDQDFRNNTVYLPVKDFSDLVKIVDSYQASDDLDDPPFRHIRHGGVSGVKASSYVGLLSLPSGTSIEILPKIADEDGDIGFTKTKVIFLRMLRCLKNQPFRNIGSGEMSTELDYPLLEIFISSFINQCKEVLRVNFRSGYSSVESNERFLRGKIVVAKNLRANLWRKDQFWCMFSEFTRNVPHNRVLKTAMNFLALRTRSSRNFSELQILLQHMEDVEISSDIGSDLRNCLLSNRLFTHYVDALETARVFLSGNSFTALKGESKSLSLLYPMEMVFQNYVADQFKRHAGMRVYLQHDEHHLIEKHRGTRLFNLRPDIFMNSGNFYAVLDTKWKLLKGSASKKYNIKEADMYQMFAYAVKYSRNLDKKIFEGSDEDDRMKFAFIYPAHDAFQVDLDPFYFFDYGLNVKVLPFDLLADPKEEVARIIASL